MRSKNSVEGSPRCREVWRRRDQRRPCGGHRRKALLTKSNFAVIGVYLYDPTVFEKIKRLKPSGRGELEITDVNNLYVQAGTLTYEILDGWWTDAGTFESLLRANNLVAQSGANKVNDEGSVDVAVRKRNL